MSFRSIFVRATSHFRPQWSRRKSDDPFTVDVSNDRDSPIHQQGRYEMISREAAVLHSHVMLAARRHGHPGFISRSYIESLPTAARRRAAELVADDFWTESDDRFELGVSAGRGRTELAG